MKKNPVHLIVSIILLGLIIGLPFAFIGWNNQLVNNTPILVCYIVAKVLFGLAFVAFAVILFVKEFARGHYLFLVFPTVVLQLVPLFVRFGLNLNNFGLVYSILLLSFVSIIYAILVGLSFYSSKRQLAADKKYEGKTIEVKEEE